MGNKDSAELAGVTAMTTATTEAPKKLESLTPEQEALMAVVEKEWLDRAFVNPKLDEVSCRAGVEWLYELAGLAKPEVRFCLSPMACQEEANKWGNEGKLPDKLHFYNFEWLGWCDYGWTAFYDFFTRIGVVKLEAFDRYVDFLKSGIYDLIAFDTVAFVSAPPDTVIKDSEGRLHSVSGPAVAWGEDFKCYFISGVSFDHKLWQQVITGAMTGKQILEMGNMEQRMIALKLKGMEAVLEDVSATVLCPKTDKGNELLLVEGVFDTPHGTSAYFLKYTCPSTGRVYLKAVDPSKMQDVDTTDPLLADKLQALSHHANLTSYTDMVDNGRES